MSLPSTAVLHETGPQLSKWLEKPIAKPLLITNKKILLDDFENDSDYHNALNSTLSLSILCILSGHPLAVNRILSALCHLPDVTLSEDQKSIFEIFWSTHPFQRPQIIPWPKWNKEHLEERTRFGDARCGEFHQTWTKTDWISKAYGIKIDETFDIHQWKTSDDPLIAAICARLLCRTISGEVPDSTLMHESFAAAHKLFTELQPRAPNIPNHHIFPLEVYFVLADYFGKQELAEDILRKSCKDGVFQIHAFLYCPALYRAIARNPQILHGLLLSHDDMDKAIEALVAAWGERGTTGQQEPMHGVPWADLLCRLSEAAHVVNNQEYLEMGIGKPKDILLPPTTPEKIAEVEAKIGPLPDDLKEMVLISDGFKGGWHFAQGGFGGISTLWVDRIKDHEVYFGIFPEPVRKTFTETREDGSTYSVVKNVIEFGAGKQKIESHYGPVYLWDSVVETDNIIHVLCPSETWSKVRGGKVDSDEYRIVMYTTWGMKEEWPSFRHWLAELTLNLEIDVMSRN